MFSSKVFALRILPENGSQLPDIHSFSDFTDLLSDMPGKGKFVLYLLLLMTSAVKQRLCLRCVQPL